MSLTSFIQSSESGNPHYLLFGNPVEHSLSPVMHNTALDYYGMDARYFAVDLQNDELTSLTSYLNNDTFLGANITIPYKQALISYLDELDHSASETGATNTIVKQNYKLRGYNTDSYGFLSPLKEFSSELVGKEAIVFGTGGASQAVVSALKKLRMRKISLVSRSPGRVTSFKNIEGVDVISYDEWIAFSQEAALIVNATPLGMYPNINQAPVRETDKQFLAGKTCYDIVYNPLKTKFLKMAEEVGARCIGGVEMLIQQGNHSFELWTGKTFPVEIIREKLHEELGN